MKTRLVFGAALFAAALPAAELYVAVSATPVAVDGEMSEYVYVGYDWSQPFIVFDRESTVTNGLFEPVGKPFCDLGTQGGVFTDATNLYVAVLAPCDGQHPAGAADGVGVAVSPDGKTVFVVECGTDGKCVVSRIGADGARTPLAASGVRGGVHVGKRSFNAEIAIPYATLGRTPDGGGAVWKCNIYRTGPSCGGISSWSPVQGDMFNTDRFGDIVFGKSRVLGVPLPENVGKTTFLWAGDRWSGGPEVKPPLDMKELEKVSLSGPRGGRAVAHFRVSNQTERPALYSFTMTDYAKNELARRIRFREVGNVELKGGPTVPDPIFDLPNGSVLRIPPKSTAMVWVDVDTEGLKPGLHKAALTLVPGYSKFEEKTLALELTVGKADIREIDMPCWTYPLRQVDDLRALRDYRFNVSCVLQPWLGPKPGPDGRRDWTQLDKVITAMLENGIRTNEVRILCYDLFPRWSNPRDKPEKERAYIENMRAGIAYVKKRWGIGLDRIWFSTVDEPHGDPDDPKSSASFAFYGAQLAKRIDPVLKSWTNPWKGEPQYLPRYLEAFDVLEPSLGHLTDSDPDAPRKYAESGKEIWSYAIYLKQNRPMQYRGISWRNFAYGFAGPSTFYDLFDMAGDGFNSYDRNGAADYGAVYKDRRTGQMSPSLRLEAWYQGHIEQRLLKWCKAHIDALQDRTQASAFAARLDALVKHAVAPRPAFDTISRELLMLSDEIVSTPFCAGQATPGNKKKFKGDTPEKYWKLEELSVVPQVRELDDPVSAWPGLKSLMVSGKGPNGTAAEFFCYYGHPEGAVPKGGFPGVVLVHGGGGTAFPQYTRKWIELGFAVIALDWYNQRPAPGLTNMPPTEVSVPRIPLSGGKRQDHVANVANMVLSHSLLRSFPEVNRDRTVFVGLSWGSWYGTCVAAVDGRFKGCVEIYCGDWNPARQGYKALVNGCFLPSAKIPMWWAVSTNDRNVTPYTSQDGFDACANFFGAEIVNYLPHSHVGFNFPSVQRMAKHFTGCAKSLPRLARGKIKDGVVSAEIIDPGEGLASAKLGYTTSSDEPTWKREWKYVPATIEGNRVFATLPSGTVQCYLSVYEAEKSRFNDMCGSTGFLDVTGCR